MQRNILIVAPVPSHPPTAGNRVRLFEMADALIGMGHNVRFMHVLQQAGDQEAMRAYWGDRYLPVPYRHEAARLRRRWRAVARRLGLPGAHTYGMDEWYSSAIDEAVDRLLATVPIDVVIVMYVFLSKALLRFPPQTLKVIDTNDAFGNRHRRYLREGQKPTWYSCSVRAEREGLSRSDLVLAIQDQEAEYFRAATPVRVEVVGHFAPLCPLPWERVVPARILAVGSSNPINTAALTWFLERVLPAVRARVPNCELAVAGSVCDHLPATPGVRTLGELGDLADAYAEAQVVINPMQLGTGLKIKSLEALTHGRALVTTAVGAAGLEAGRDTAFRLADDPADFAAEVGDLLVHPARAQRLAAAGYQFACAYTDGVRRSLEQLFDVPASVREPP